MNSKNPHAAALGRIKTPAKAASSRANGKQSNGRPQLPRCPLCTDKPRRCAACRKG